LPDFHHVIAFAAVSITSPVAGFSLRVGQPQSMPPILRLGLQNVR